MGFWKTLFGGHEETEEEKEERHEQYDFEVLTFDGREALRVRKTDYGIACLERALTLREDADTRQLLASGYLQKDDLANAERQYARLAELQPDDTRWPVAQAELLYQQERYAEMETACHRALELNPELPRPHTLLACMAHRQNDADTALLEASAALTLRPEDEEARLLRAQVTAEAGRYEEAQADVDFLLAASDSPSDEALLAKARLCQARSQYGEAESFYRRVIAQNPFVPQSYIRLGGLLRQLGREDEARQVMDEAAEQFGMSPEQAEQLAPREGESMEEYMRKAYNTFNPLQLNV